MNFKRKILEIMKNDQLTHIEHCKSLLSEKNLSIEDAEFLCTEIGDSTEWVERVDWVLPQLKGD